MEIDIESEIKKAIRHDFHKMYGRKHDNTEIGLNADKDASNMSRNHKKKPEFNDDDRNYRVSLVSGYLLMPDKQEIRLNLRELIEEKYNDKLDAKTMFMNLLNCNEISKFNETPDLEFTSLKYHSILTTVLYYNYLKGYKFKDLYFGIVDTKDVNDIFEVVFLDKQYEKCFTFKSSCNDLKSFTRLGTPMENFGDVISRCGNTEYMNLDILSNLRRIKSWSTGLQYYDDICRGSL